MKSTVPFQIVTVVSSGFALWKSFHEVNIPLVVWLIVVAAIGAIVFNIGRSAYLRATAQELPEPGGDFAPFRGTREWKPLARENLTKDLAELIAKTATKHVLLVSRSGAGKSTMLQDLIPPKMQEKGYDTKHLDNYANFTISVLLVLQAFQADAEQKTDVGSLIKDIAGGNFDKGLICKRIENLLPRIALTKSVLMCFDQVERYVLAFETDNDLAVDDGRHDIIAALVKSLAKNNQVRTLFAIRSEYLAAALSSMFSIETNGADIDENVEFYLLWGINDKDDADDCTELTRKLTERNSGFHIRDTLFRIGQVGNRMRANTFILNLAGYLLEKFSDRKKYSSRLLKPELSADELIDVYLDAAFEGYAAKSESANRSLFDTVLYALANENKVTGQACSGRRLAGLAHYPEEDVSGVVGYLETINVVSAVNIEMRDEENGSVSLVKFYRIGHEKISDRVLKSDKINLDSRAIDGIRYLTENRVRSESLTIPTSFPTSLDLTAIRSLDVSYIALVVFVIFGFTRCLAPQATYDFVNNWTGLYSWVSSTFHYKLHTYYMEPVMYVPHFLVHVAWASYIDRINRSFVRFTAAGFLWFLGYCMTPVGVVIGIAVAYCPELFAIPIVCIGILYGIILMVLSRTKSLGGQIKDIALAWGFRSIVNVIVVLVGGEYVIAQFFQAADSGNPKDISNTLLLIVSESVLMLWFWWHIRADQNVSKIWSANLALFDKGRIFGR